ncbi:MAG: hypothetical protein JWP37_2292 [Mucilaginibacter sp.]|nr:hypothetical protein [Mucilaginibacter sp.]
MPNIKFNYRYRDGANYKNHGFVIFKSDPAISVEELQSLIQSKLIDKIWFYADEWKLPELFLDTFDFKIDPTWHEFESVEFTDESPNSIFDLKGLVNTLTLL